MEIVKVEDLMVGDEIVIPHMSKFLYLKVMTQPKKRTKALRWGGGNDGYKAVKCSCKVNSKTHVWANGYKTTEHEYEFTGLEHNGTKYVDLNYKSIMLIKRETL